MDKMAWVGRCLTVVAVAVPGSGVAFGVAPDDGLKQRIHEQLRLDENEAASELIERHLEQNPSDAVMLYNAACVQARLGELDRGARYFIKAVKSGFGDISYARRDPDLKPLRPHPVFRAIVDARAAADEMLARRRMEQWRERFGDDGYRYEVDSSRQLIYVSSLDDKTHGIMRDALERQTDHLEQTLFPGARGHVLLVLPNREQVADLLTRKYVNGLYNHRRRELVTRGHPRAMRHELTHAIHHGHMDTIGQDHPLWIQEGVASLYEHYELDHDGSVRFLPNDRDEQIATLAANDWLMTWSELATVKPASMRGEAYRVYPQLRSVFRFMAEQGHLETWYRAYVDGFDTDPTGLTAIEQTFGSPIESVEAAWRRWLDEQG